MKDVFQDYKEKPCADFQRLTGVNKGTFEILLGKYQEGVSAYLSEKPKRKCGVQVGLSLENQLLLCLLYLREYHTLLELGAQFGISESYAQKRYVFAKGILLKVLQCPDIACLTTTIETNLVAVDVTEQPIERPLEGQEDYYSGKKTPYHKSATLCMPFNRAD